MYHLEGSYLWFSLLFSSSLRGVVSHFFGYNSYKNSIPKNPTKTAGRHTK